MPNRKRRLQETHRYSLAELEHSAVRAALAAGKVLRKYFGKKLKIDEKKNAGLVTNADLQAEEAALKILSRATPDFGFLTEETHPTASQRPGEPGRWILDPLDGTTNFVHKFPMFCVSIGAEVQGVPTVGVIYHPIFNDLYVAVRGKGARLNGKRIHVSNTKKLGDSLLTTGFAYTWNEEALARDLWTFQKLSIKARAIRRPGSAAMDLAYTARGVFDAFWERNLSPWDISAGALLVQEAGGKVTNYFGEPLAYSQRQILASNGKIHRLMVNTIGEIAEREERKKS
jgi:myo-inositol-1(or 4)-monophosphatase